MGFIANGVEFFFGWLPDWMQFVATSTIAILIVTIGVILVVAFST